MLVARLFIISHFAGCFSKYGLTALFCVLIGYVHKLVLNLVHVGDPAVVGFLFFIIIFISNVGAAVGGRWVAPRARACSVPGG